MNNFIITQFELMSSGVQKKELAEIWEIPVNWLTVKQRRRGGLAKSEFDTL